MAGFSWFSNIFGVSCAVGGTASAAGAAAFTVSLAFWLSSSSDMFRHHPIKLRPELVNTMDVISAAPAVYSSGATTNSRNDT